MKTMYRVPPDAEILKALYTTMHRRRTVDSQRELKGIVQAELENINSDYKVSEKRLRHLTLRSGFVAVEIHTREEQERKKRRMIICPVCEEKLKKLRNKTIFGGIVTLGYHCQRCSYWTGLRRRIPMRYVFHISEMAKPKKRVKSRIGRINNIKFVFGE